MKKFMRLRRLFPLILLLCLLFSSAAPAALALEAPDIPAKAAVLVDLDSGRVLYEKNMNEERAPASLTKVMTVLLAYEALESGEIALTDQVTAQADCRAGMDESSSTAGIQPGMTLSMEELLYCAMISSANEACNIIASHISGSVSAFVERMNEKAAELGCGNTHFANTNGLPAEGHYSSAYDLYLITREALTHPGFLELCDTRTYTPTLTQLNDGKPLVNSNALLTTGGAYGDNYVYQYASGVKTGYTNAAGYCLISTAEKDGVHVLAVVLGCDGFLNAGLDEYRNFEASIDLYDWAFGNFSWQTALSTEETAARAPVAFARDEAEAVLRPQESVRALLPNDVDPAGLEKTVTIYEEALSAPLEAGAVLGEITVSYEGESLGTVKLVNAARVELARGEFMKQRLAELFSNRYVIIAVAVIGLFLLIYLILVLRYRALRRKMLRQRRAAEKRRRQQAAREAQSRGGRH